MSNYRIVIEYDPIEGEVRPDGKVWEYITEIIRLSKNEYLTSPIVLVIGSTIILDAFRVAIKEERLYYKDVIIRFRRKNIVIDKDGKINSWPEGLCVVYDDILDRLL